MIKTKPEKCQNECAVCGHRWITEGKVHINTETGAQEFEANDDADFTCPLEGEHPPVEGSA